MKMNKILDIYTIQNSPQELYLLLDQIVTNDVVIFQNVKGELIVDNKKYDIEYNGLIYSEESDILIMISNVAKIKLSDVERYLISNNINYSLIKFLEIAKKKSLPEKEFWFARDEYVVEQACYDSLAKCCPRVAKFDEHAKGKLSFNYISSDDLEKTEFDAINIDGVITFEDKIVFVVDDGNDIQGKKDNMYSILVNNDFKDVDLTEGQEA